MDKQEMQAEAGYTSPGRGRIHATDKGWRQSSIMVLGKPRTAKKEAEVSVTQRRRSDQ